MFISRYFPPTTSHATLFSGTPLEPHWNPTGTLKVWHAQSSTKTDHLGGGKNSTLNQYVTRYLIRSYVVFKVRISSSGVKTYVLMYRNAKGRRVRYTIGKHGTLTFDQAKKLAKDKAAEVHQGRDPQAEKREARTVEEVPTLGQYVEERYLPWFNAHFRARTTKSTFEQFRGLFEDKLDEITAWKVEKWRKARLKAGQKQATVNRHIAALRAAFNRAVEWGLVESNPLSGIKQFREDPLAIIRFLSPEEEGRLRGTLKRRQERMRRERDSANQWRESRSRDALRSLRRIRFTDHLMPMVILSLNTGIRQGELFSLRWEKVDLKRKVITIIGTSAKSDQTRHIPLNSEALDTFRQWRKQQPEPGLVFPNANGSAFDNVKAAWTRLLRDAEITRFRWHDMRHHFASKLVMAGVDLNTVRELLGHSDLTMTLRYAHLAPEHKAAAVEKLANG